MANITEYLKQIQALTNKNLEILSAINQSFFTKKTNTTVQLENEKYIIPSFLALESKLQVLEDNFENLVNAPKTGVAAFSFDGNTQGIQMMSFSNTPEAVKAETKTAGQFGIKPNNKLKDFLSPIPYIKLDISNIPNDINKVNVRKVVFKSEEAQSKAKGLLAGEASAKIDWVRILGITDLLNDWEYSIYDTVMDMPVRDNSKHGKFTIKEIANNYVDSNLDEHYEVYVNEELKITDGNGKETTLEVTQESEQAFYLICNDGKTKLLVEQATPASKYLKFKVLYGSYANLVENTSGMEELSTLYYFNEPTFDEYKYVDIPLEENQYVAVFVDAINSLNVKGVTNEGLLYDTYKLMISIDPDTEMSFEEYYKNVNNIGDKIESLSKMLEAGLESYSEEDYDYLTKFVPEAETFVKDVKQINQHLNNSTTIENIRDLHAQKQQAKQTLQGLQEEIKQINDLINKIDFNDTAGTRELYESQLQDKQSQYEQTQATITKLTDAISDEANKSVLPIENAKFHIRGFIEIDEDLLKKIAEGIKTASQKIDIAGVEVWYRYKNQNSLAGNAMSIDEKYVYSDWNVMPKSVSNRTISYTEGTASYGWSYDKDSVNEPCFNQVDIPITQGEIVDVKFRYIYDICYPLTQVASAWSEVVSVEFPAELVENVEVLDIINENNDEVRKNAFDNILTKYGVQDHCADKLKENDATFWHKADNITSGFYTEEQKIISLKEKLWQLSNDVTRVSDEVFGTTVEELTVTVSNENNSIVLNENADNVFIASSYKELKDKNSLLEYVNGSEVVKTIVATETLSLILQNKSNKTVKLFPLFYGKDQDEIAGSQRYDIKDYKTPTTTGGYYTTPKLFTYNSAGDKILSPQHFNQVLYFRLKNPYTNKPFHTTDSLDPDTAHNFDKNGLLGIKGDDNYWKVILDPNIAGEYKNNGFLDSLRFDAKLANTTQGKAIKMSTLCPFVQNISSIQIPENEKCLVLHPNEGVKLSLLWDFSFGDEVVNSSTKKTISFDVRTSLYTDPKNYILTVVSHKEQQVQDSDKNKNRYNTTIIN